MVNRLFEQAGHVSSGDQPSISRPASKRPVSKIPSPTDLFL